MTDNGLSSGIRVDQIDHVELFVPERRTAADWYRRTLGLEVVSAYEHWADHPRGPLMISSDSGSTKLALFTGTPQGTEDSRGFHRVAFRVDSAGFLHFVRQLPRPDLTTQGGEPLTADMVVVHDSAFSIYFSDPYGNQLELTTYAYEEAKSALSELPETSLI